MNNEQFIKDLLPLVGGKENIKKAIHCHTRLRLTLYNYDLVQNDEVRALEGVMTTKDSADQYQIVVGEKVKEVYKELLKYGSFSGGDSSGEGQKGNHKKRNPIAMFAETMSAVFTP